MSFAIAQAYDLTLMTEAGPKTAEDSIGPSAHSERVPELDGLRGIAIALVMAQHALLHPYLPFWEELLGAPIAHVFDVAWAGVDIFFVLSGFLIGGIILDHRGFDRFYPAFYARRTARIFPAYFLLLALACLRFGEYGPQTGAVPLLGYVTFTSNLYTSMGVGFTSWLRPLWSVSIEEQFYVVAPFCLRALPARMIPWILGALIAGSASVRTAALLGRVDLGFSVWDFTLTRLDGLSFGVLAAWLLRQPTAVRAARERATALGSVFVLLLVVSLWIAQQNDATKLGLGILWLTLTAFVAIVLVRLQPASWLGRILRVRQLVYLGRYSYFLYLFHMPVLWAASTFSPAFYEAPVPSRLALNTLALVVLSTIAPLSWHYFEAPLLALGRRIAYGRKQDQTGAKEKPATAA